MTGFDAAVRAALNAVYDPCSVAAGRPLGLVDMGLALGWTLDAGTLRLTFCTTSGECMIAPHFIEAARDRLCGLAGVARVEIDIDHAFIWTPDRMASRTDLLERTLVPWAERAAVSGLSS